MLLFKLFYERFEELLFHLHLIHLSADLYSYNFLHASHLLLFTTCLCVELEMPYRTAQQASLVEVLAELSAALLLLDFSCVVLPLAEKFFRLVCASPLFNPGTYDGFVSIALHTDKC